MKELQKVIEFKSFKHLGNWVSYQNGQYKALGKLHASPEAATAYIDASFNGWAALIKKQNAA